MTIIQPEWVYGHDISEAQGPNFSFKNLEAAGSKFCWIRATHGTASGAYVDTQFYRNWEECGKTNIKRGAYMVTILTGDPILQARICHETVGAMRKEDLPIAIDFEVFEKNMSRDQHDDWLLTCAKEVRRLTGKKPIIYAGAPYEWTLGKSTRKELLEYWLWIAQYSKTIFKVPSPWSLEHCIAWQCTGNIGPKIPGFGNMPIDRNFALSDSETFDRRLAALNESSPIFPFYTTRGLQRSLFQLGHNPGKIDNVMGPKTKNALLEFQKCNSIPETGVLDDQTKAVLENALVLISNSELVETLYDSVCEVVNDFTDSLGFPVSCSAGDIEVEDSDESGTV